MARGVSKGGVGARPRRAKVEPPQIFVCVGSDRVGGRMKPPQLFIGVGRKGGATRYCEAQLGNRGGYPYLFWEDGSGTREFDLVTDRPRYSQAHLRNRRGYLYLSWRDGERVREFYLGKGRKASPTGSTPRYTAGTGAGTAAAGGTRRAKKKAGLRPRLI